MAAEQTTYTPGPGVRDTLGPGGRDALIEFYEQDARDILATAATRADNPQPPSLAKQQRLDLLNALPLGDLTGKVCVDFGVGPRGFGASFPRLQNCGKAIGVDFALTAVNASAEISARGQARFGRNFTYLTSRGDRIELPDASVDIVYAGNSIERVENPDGFLEEAHRILRPGGLLVLTTIQAEPESPCAPSAAPAWRAPEVPPTLRKRLRRITPQKLIARVGQMFRVNRPVHRLTSFLTRSLAGPGTPTVAPSTAENVGEDPFRVDHLGELTYTDLRKFLEPRFDVLQAHGYGAPIAQPLPTATLADQPERARGIVLLARKRADYRPVGRYCQRRYPYSSHDLHVHGGPWQVVCMYGWLMGRKGSGGEACWLTLPIEGSALVLIFWAWDWGGEAIIEVGGIHRSVNLYSAKACFKRVFIDGFKPGRHVLRISGSANRDPRSSSNQILFYEAIAYGHEDGPEQNGKPRSGPVRPVRTEAEREQLRKRVTSRPWFHTIDLGDGIVTSGLDWSSDKVAYLGLPERLDGLSVLDVGAYDGFFSFECERRGAKRVVAADHFCWTYGVKAAREGDYRAQLATKDGFDLARAALGSQVEEAMIPVEEISPERLGEFDLVLFLGVLYHASDMLRYLRIVRSVCRRQVILETEVDAEDYPLPAAVFYQGSALNDDRDNFWGPNQACVEAMLREAGFRRIERICTFNIVRRGNRPYHRAVFHAFV